MSFQERVQQLPALGLGVSTEYGAADAPGSLDVLALRAEHPEYAQFLEIGIETAKGLDPHARAWVERGWPTTYHFLDVNLDEPGDLDARWLDEVRSLVAQVTPAWLCGDAGLWHVGRRDRAHMLLLPPVLTDRAAWEMAEGIARLREETGCEVLPENPPGVVYVGDLHLLEFFARVCARADTGMLLDAAHLAIYQRVAGHAPTTGLDGFPLERVVEIHVAGGIERWHEGFAFVEDAHIPQVLPDTWTILERVAPRAVNLRAAVFECERNPLQACVPGFAQIAGLLARAGRGSIAAAWGRGKAPLLRGGVPHPRGDAPPLRGGVLHPQDDAAPQRAETPSLRDNVPRPRGDTPAEGGEASR